MNEQQKQIITNTVGILKSSGPALTEHFYKRMFQGNPELKNIFNMGNQQNGKQRNALAGSLLAYAENINNLNALLPLVQVIAHKHVSVNIRREHYPIVGHHLIESIKEVLGEGATPEVIEAWTLAYNQLAQVFIDVEAGLYAKHVENKNWTGWRPFTVKSKVQESEEITSLYLAPTDGSKVSHHIPGQYVSLQMFIPELQLNQPRQYSISSKPNDDYYRISVKRERGANIPVDGMISNRLHDFVKEGDIVEITAPAGTFVLQNHDAPVVLISGGVGVTPLISMLESLEDSNFKKPVVWVHGARSNLVHAFKKRVNEIATKMENLTQYIFYNVVTEKEKSEGVIEGIVELSSIKELPEGAKYYICGPKPFIEKQCEYLLAKGIKKEDINFEEFGPKLVNL